MATKYWLQPAAGDWYSGQWYTVSGGSAVASTVPVAGDVVFLQSSPVSITSTDVTQFGTLAGLDIVFAGASTLTMTGETIAQGSTIEADYNNVTNSLTLGGVSTLSGLLLATAVSTSFGVALQSNGTLNVSSTGEILARNAGTVTLTGATGAKLVNAGTIQAGFTLAANSYEAGAVSLALALDNSGQVTTGPFGLLSLTGPVTNEAAGTIVDTGGSIVISGSLVNAGLVSDTSGALSISGNVSGSGTILVGDGQTVSVTGNVAAGQTISFATGVGTLDIGKTTGFAATVAGLTGHDIIDLQGLANATATVNGSSVTISAGGSVQTVFQATGLSGPLNSVSDGNGGTILTLKLPGAESQVVGTIVNGANGSSAHSWGPGGTTVTYSFDAGSAWTTAEQQAFVNGLNLWSTFANIHFAQASSGTGQVVFVRSMDGAANTVSSTNTTTHIIQSATISIDTRVGAWQNLSNIGTLDTTGYGGYGWSTILHEEGHLVGLFHPGNYNETADLATQQTYYTDTHQYSVMSYFDASASGANWNNGTQAYNLDTPMLFDIAAAQSIYGSNTTTLAGNDVFGFNASSSITGNAALDAVYDFNTDKLPIETIWDGGTHNTLDLSGWSTVETINLNAGGFSSVDGLTNNLAIAYGTTIDTAIGGSGNDVFIVNADSDRIVGGSGANTAVFSGARANYTIAYNPGSVTVTALSGGAVDTLTNVQTLQFSDTSVTACFVTGTRILTTRGEVAVEDLVIGDLVATRLGGATAPIRWIGRRSVEAARHPDPGDISPVRIAAGAFGGGAPARDLLLSPDHAVFAGGVLIPVRHLVNGTSIAQPRRDRFTYWHIELDRHDVMLAEGLPVESFLENDNRHFFEGDTVMSLHPAFPDNSGANPCARIVSQGETLEEVRRHIARQTLVAAQRAA